MMQLLNGFAALSLVSGALVSILPEGSMRRTACMSVGLLMLLYWAEGLAGLAGTLQLSAAEAPASVLGSTGVDLSAMQAALVSAAEALP